MKIKGRVNLLNSDGKVIDNKKFNGLKTNNQIIYYEDLIKVNIIIDDKIMMKRSSSEYEIILLFKENMETEGKYLLKKDNLFLPLYINTDKIIVDNNLLTINYRLNDENFEFKLEFEVEK